MNDQSMNHGKKVGLQEKSKNILPKHNLKAFAIRSTFKAEKQFRRKQDIIAKREHAPKVDRTPLEPPPFIVSVVGPPKVGKSTLIRCLIRHYTRQNITQIRGPITVVCNKHLRLTFIECNNDINCMVDISKISDLVLLLVDASFGFEMETFEFLNICQVHGSPKIMGVLTHLDAIKNPTKLKKVKKELKHRFWTEIYTGAKLFYLSKMAHNSYLKNEIHNLARFISVIKFRQLQWASNHPYLLVDRFEDITDSTSIENNDNCNRKVCLFGFSRGANFKLNQNVHIPGCGDFRISDLSTLHDPCPLPEKEEKNLKRRRSLKEKEMRIYAPMAGVGGIIFDKDAIYIDIGGSHSLSKKNDEIEPDDKEGLSSIKKSEKSLSNQMSSTEIKIFSQMNSLISDSSNIFENDEKVQTRRKVNFFDEENEAKDQNINNFSQDDQVIDSQCLNEEFEINVNDWKNNIQKKAYEAFKKRIDRVDNIQELVYDSHDIFQEENNENFNQFIDNTDQYSSGFLKMINFNSKNAAMKFTLNSKECSKFHDELLVDFSDQENFKFIRDCFVSGKWDKESDVETVLKNDSSLREKNYNTESDSDNDFEDLEKSFDIESSDEEISSQNALKNIETKNQETHQIDLNKKFEKKQQFNEDYDNIKSADVLNHEEKTFLDFEKEKMLQQTKINREEFENLSSEQRIIYEGFPAGSYLRVVLNDVPYEFIKNFDPSYPIILGGLESCETNIGYVRVRIKKHRWYKRILKSRDPLIVSLGWRRFQTQVFFSIEDHNGRNRLLKYTPQHMHCHGTFWGPITPQNTGFVAFQSVSEQSSDFRISATGVVLDLDKTSNIEKKLKLVGRPVKVFKNTAFIQNMFNSALEVTKFEGAAIKTVSGIRGQIKKPIRSPIGAFRATFEDKISINDIVFLRSWVSVPITKFYATVTSLLLPVEEKQKWVGMKTLGKLRNEMNLKALNNVKSHYTESKRKVFNFKPFVIPKKLQEELPFKAKPKLIPEKLNKLDRIAVIKDSHERKTDSLIKKLKTVYKEHKRQDRLVMEKRTQNHKKQLQKVEKIKLDKMREKKKFVMKQLGKANKI